AYQVYAVAFDLYPRPIPTPIQNLRPAQETCEQCHWPQHFFSQKQEENAYFLSDENNTRWNLNLLMKIGGGNIEAGPTSGIHWHMNISNEVTYAHTDSTRGVIPWVRSKSADGSVKIFKSTETALTDEEIASLPTRRMDCIDCHNRPTHIYHPPARSVNHTMALGWINPELPFVKSVAVEALEHTYSTKESGLDSIGIIIEGFYSEKYPEVSKTRQADIQKTIEETRRIFSRNYFPEMRVDWKRFTDNIGHLYYPGCFRCHDEKHVSDSGETLTKDCNVCHTIIAQEFEKGTQRLSLKGVEYRHPVDIGEAWKLMNCSDCHNPQ
ncbi:MAG: cytochrome C, partial [Bacteroidota bacterium]